MSGLATAVGAPSSPLPVFRSAVGNPFDRPYTAWQFGMAPSSEDADPLLEHLLLRRALQGDDKAFVALASMHSAAVYATARQGNPPSSERAAFASQVAARRMGPIRAESGRLASLLDKLLLLARAEAGSVPREGVHLERWWWTGTWSRVGIPTTFRRSTAR